MLVSPSIALMMLVLLSGTSTTGQTCPPPGETEGRCIELTADGAGEISEIQISPGQLTTFLFDSDLQTDGMTLERRERFEVAPGKRLITLVPSERIRGERPSRVTVCFADGAAPACATFRLVVHPAIAEHRVEIFRHPRPVDSIQAELKKSYVENARLRAEIERMRAERGGPGGLSGLFASGVMDERGIPCSRLRVVQRLEDEQRVLRLFACRAPGKVAVRLELQNREDEAPWTARGARLRGPKGEALKGSVWSPGFVRPGEPRPIYVEMQAKDARAVGPFVLKLWEADGPGTVTLRNVTFPALVEEPEL